MKFVDTQDLDLQERLNVAKETIKKDKENTEKNINVNLQNKKISYGFSLSKTLIEKLNAYCKNKYINKSILVEMAIKEYVKKNELFDIEWED